jgi:hypothetical protein
MASIELPGPQSLVQWSPRHSHSRAEGTDVRGHRRVVNQLLVLVIHTSDYPATSVLDGEVGPAVGEEYGVQ